MREAVPTSEGLVQCAVCLLGSAASFAPCCFACARIVAICPQVLSRVLFLARFLCSTLLSLHADNHYVSPQAALRLGGGQAASLLQRTTDRDE